MTWISDLASPSAATLVPLSSPQTIARAQAVIGESATAWCVGVAAEINEQYETLAAENPDVVFTGLERRATEASSLTIVSAIHLGDPAPAPPVEVNEQVRLAARQGARLEHILRTVWIAHGTLQRRLFAGLAASVPAPEYAGRVAVLADQLLAYADSLTRSLSIVYDEERANWHERIAGRRREVLEAVVATGRAPDDAESVLGIRLTDTHLVAIVRAPGDSADSAGRDSRARSVIAAATRSLGDPRHVIVDRHDESLVTIWTFPGPPREDPVDRLRELDLPRDAAIAFGSVRPGVAGLRLSALDAGEADRVARRTGGRGLYAYRDVALDALLLADPAAAGRFVRSALEGLTDRDEKSAGLRETLHSYLRHGRSRQQAGAELHLAAGTVAYRVEHAQSRLTHGLELDPNVLLIALRLAIGDPALLEET